MQSDGKHYQLQILSVFKNDMPLNCWGIIKLCLYYSARDKSWA